MKRNTELLNKRIIELSKELEQDLKLDNINIGEKSLCCPALKSKWLMIFFEENAVLERFETALEKLKDNYIEKNKSNGVPKLKYLRDVETTDEYKKIYIAIHNQKEIIRYLDGVNKIFAGFGYDIKNSIDYIKMENM